MKIITIFLLIFCEIILIFQTKANNDEQFDNMRRTVGQDAYSLQQYEVNTNDGYLLSLHRIKTNGPPVLLMHGLLGSSNDFVVFGNEKSLANSLADQNYDVWMGNNRGNTLSRKHNKIDVTDPTFWDFSFHEMGYFDCPALIDYILKETNQSSVTFIGHAQGATQALVMLATRPEYSAKVNLITAFSPFTYMSHIPHPILQLLKEEFSLFEIIMLRFKVDEFLPHVDLLAKLLSQVCQQPAISKICSLVPYLLGGMNPKPLEVDIPSAFLNVFPAGTSLKNIKHLFQQIKTGHFQQYDYGLIGNLNKYKTTVPPTYNLTNIQIPVNIFHSQNDWLAGEQDIKRLAQELPSSETKVISLKYFNHYDFFIAKNVKSLLHFDVVNILNKHHNKSEITSTSSTEVPNTPSTKQQSTHAYSTITHVPPSITPTQKPTPTTSKPNSGFSLQHSLLLYVISIIFFAIG